jgi:hypothetical protein
VAAETPLLRVMALNKALSPRFQSAKGWAQRSIDRGPTKKLENEPMQTYEGGAMDLSPKDTLTRRANHRHNYNIRQFRTADSLPTVLFGRDQTSKP